MACGKMETNALPNGGWSELGTLYWTWEEEPVTIPFTSTGHVLYVPVQYPNLTLWKQVRIAHNNPHESYGYYHEHEKE